MGGSFRKVENHDRAAKQGILGAILVAGALFLINRQPHEAAGQVPAGAQQWEYRVVDVQPWISRAGGGRDRDRMTSSVTTGYNELAAAGWEYAGEAPGAMSLAVFKRPKR